MESTVAPDTAQTTSPPPGAEHRSYAVNKPLIILALILATALSALDGTIVATAMPSIVGALGGLPLYSMVIAAYALTATTTVPVFGKLSDMYGRKPVFLAGAGIFIVGSSLCGLAWDMPSLIVFRAVQGLGAGAVIPVSLTLIGDLFEVEERARIQGVFSAVWGVSSVIGPLIGGAIVQFFNWRWVFFINVPIGIVSGVLFFLYLREPSIHTRQRVDIAGTLTLTFGVGALLIGLQSGGHSGWTAPLTLLSLGVAAALLAAFALIESRVSAPLLTLGLLSRPVIAISCLVGLLSGGVLVGISAYVPPLVQGSWGGTPIEAGLIIAPLSIGWPIASSMSGRLIMRVGYRSLVLVGTLLILAGTLIMMLVLLPAVSSSPLLRPATIISSTFVAGCGFGASASTMLIAVQNSVPWDERGIATAATQFFRNMGNTIGAALLGAVLTASLVPLLAAPHMQEILRAMPPAAAGVASDPALGPVNALFDLSVRDTIDRVVRSALAGALEDALGWVFFGIAVMAAIGAILAARFPKLDMPGRD